MVQTALVVKESYLTASSSYHGRLVKVLELLHSVCILNDPIRANSSERAATNIVSNTDPRRPSATAGNREKHGSTGALEEV